MDVKMKKSVPKKKKNDEIMNAKNYNRFLITVNVFGSAGPLRFVVNGDDNAARVIEIALKLYTREGRLPVLDCDVNSFFLYPANAGLDALYPTESIGSHGVRSFILCKRQRHPHMTEARSQIIARKRGGLLAWLQKSLSRNTLSH